MADMHKVRFYPVGNGDTSQIELANGRRVLFDYCHRRDSDDDGCPLIDLNTRLKNELAEVSRDYFDVVGFTHADEDHICGSTDFFELQHAAKYQGKGRIKMRQLWVPAAMLLEEATNDQQSDEFVILRQEARHRLLEGQGILVFSRPQGLLDWLEPRLKERGESPSARDHLFIDAGTLVPGFSLDTDGVEFFCHSPFIKHCDEGDTIRNRAALIFNVRFRADGYSYDFLQVGDAEWDVLEDIVRTTYAHNNADRLNWNLYNLPHHCSYLALSDEKGEKETVPKPLVKELLLQGQVGAYMVSSSRPITDMKESYEQTQPPHIQACKAYEHYLCEVGGRKLLVTMEEPNGLHPEPLEFEISRSGIAWERASSSGAGSLIAAAAPRAG
jgi:hypothetical protein